MALKKIGGLWISTGKNGTKYMSGKLDNGQKILIFRNTRKTEGSKMPDYQIYEPTDDPTQPAPKQDNSQPVDLMP